MFGDAFSDKKQGKETKSNETNRIMKEWMGWMNEWTKEWMNELMKEGLDEWMNELINKWMNECMKEWMNE